MQDNTASHIGDGNSGHYYEATKHYMTKCKFMGPLIWLKQTRISYVLLTSNTSVHNLHASLNRRLLRT